MPSTQTICYYAMYVIGEVESQWDWTAVNYNDPITIGMLQWSGTRAASLLLRVKDEMPEAYTLLASSLRDSLEAYPATSQYWNSRYLNTIEGNSVITVFQSEQNHVIQENQAIADFESYIPVLEGWGMSESYPKPLIFAMSMYHQSPQYAGQVVATAGGSADLDRLYTVCLNHSVLGQYYNRYTTIYNRLKAWDGDSEPPDFGQVGDVSTTPGNTPGISTKPSELGYIIERGNVLFLYGKGDYSNGVAFYPAGTQRWVNGFNANGTIIEGGNTGGGSTESGAAIIEYARSVLGQWRYNSGSPSRLNPPAGGETDCSGFVWWCYHHVAGLDLGTWTGTQSANGRLIWRGATLSEIPWDEVKAGDILFMTADYSALWNFDKYECDVQLCTGNANETIGAGLTSLPIPAVLTGSSIDVYNGSVGYMIRRVLPDG